MALTFTTKSGFASRIYHMFGGLTVKFVTVTVGATTDYSVTGGSEGLDIGGATSLTAMGFRSLLGVASVSHYVEAGTQVFGFVPTYNKSNGRLRFYEQNAGVGAFAEIDQADFTAADTVSFLAFGF